MVCFVREMYNSNPELIRFKLGFGDCGEKVDLFLKLFFYFLAKLFFEFLNVWLLVFVLLPLA